MNERVEQTWVVRRIGTIGPAVTIPAENKNRESGFTEGVEYLRRTFRELAALSTDEFECSLHSVPLGPVIVSEEDRKKKAK
jgi:hypothetical protein